MPPIPLPARFPDPPPEFLPRRMVLDLFKLWGVGGKRYLMRLVESRNVHAVPRPPLIHGRVYRTTEIFSIYRKTVGNYNRELVKTAIQKHES